MDFLDHNLMKKNCGKYCFLLKICEKKNIPFNIGKFNFVNSNNKSDSEVNFGRELTHDCQSQKMY